MAGTLDAGDLQSALMFVEEIEIKIEYLINSGLPTKSEDEILDLRHCLILQTRHLGGKIEVEHGMMMVARQNSDLQLVQILGEETETTMAKEAIGERGAEAIAGIGAGSLAIGIR